MTAKKCVIENNSGETSDNHELRTRVTSVMRETSIISVTLPELINIGKVNTRLMHREIEYFKYYLKIIVIYKKKYVLLKCSLF